LLDTRPNDSAKWIQIECGAYHTVGLTKKGEVFTWGHNYSGQLGHVDRNERKIPTKVASLDGLVITQISCGDSHIAVLTDKGEIFTWYVQS
jgi:alpha-tubulin suppressor-like RCC1 family protein